MDRLPLGSGPGRGTGTEGATVGAATLASGSGRRWEIEEATEALAAGGEETLPAGSRDVDETLLAGSRAAGGTKAEAGPVRRLKDA